MSDPNILKRRQPDAAPDPAPGAAPSVTLYGLLIACSVVLIAAAFAIKVDWPGLFLNLGASLITAVVILVFVDRKLRSSELQTMQDLPRRVSLRGLRITSAKHRQFYRYARVYLASLQKLLHGVAAPAHLDGIMGKSETGFMLVGLAGSGKTTLLQLIAARRLRDFLHDPRKKVPLLFPMRLWDRTRSLEEAIHAHINRFCPVSRRSFSEALDQGDALVILDGADEVEGMSPQDLAAAVSAFRSAYPRAAWIISSRSEPPSPLPNLPIVDLTAR